MRKDSNYIICIFIAFIVSLVLFDYMNLPSLLGFEMSNLNWDFCMELINAAVVIVLYFITYKVLDSRTVQREENKKETSMLLINDCYRECLYYVQLLNQETVEKYIVPKMDFNSTNQNAIICNLQDTPFSNEAIIWDLIKDGQIEKNRIEGYLKIKRKFQQYVNIRIIFFDSAQHYEPIKVELCNLINIELKK